MADQSRWLRGLLGETTDGLYIVDCQHRIATWNRGAERLLGYTAAEVLNRPCYEVVAGCNADGEVVCGPDCPVRRSIRQGELPASMELSLRTSNGRRIWLHVTVIVMHAGPASFLAHVFHDVSDGRQAAEAMSQVASVLMANGSVRAGDGETGSGLARRPERAAPAEIAAPFTTREREVLRSLATGLSNAAIAEHLGVSPFTVRSHVQRILAKAGLHSRSEAVAFAFRNHLL